MLFLFCQFECDEGAYRELPLYTSRYNSATKEAWRNHPKGHTTLNIYNSSPEINFLSMFMPVMAVM